VPTFPTNPTLRKMDKLFKKKVDKKSLTGEFKGQKLER